MSDITQLILDDHETFRREFAALDDGAEPEHLREIWEPLAALLEVHAAAEEAVFYRKLLRRGDDGEDETLDAIGDHNDIATGCARQAGIQSALRSGGTVCGGRGWPTAAIWQRKRTRPYRIYGATHH